MLGVPAVYYHGTGSENAGRAYTETPMQHVQRNALRKKLDLTNGQLTPNNNTPLLTQALSDYTAGRFRFPVASSPHRSLFSSPASREFQILRVPPAYDLSPLMNNYQSVASYVQAAASPQPPTTAFPAIAVSRAPLNYSPVSPFNAPFLFTGSGPSR
ncbi:RNA-binding protein Musashi like protein Rbp6 [Trachymyrmex zeteki]|uniref:RNA-binding protein Musashi like protein Rbp6 n=1 Tax=Mycetomoellerius zeteki TaxID=64791 RepID=A0A151XDX9_9HYME|nr:RNA-binding protein Musashi like protein Rbp6 [Trachymyrmex zeteki]